MAHQSDSTVQRQVEPLILSGLAAEVGIDLAPRSLLLDGGARVDIDGVADDESVFVEIFAHQGPLKGSQFHKVARDALKLITVARSRPAARLFIAFADVEAAAGVSGGSWLAESLRAWSITVKTVDLGDRVRDRLRAAQSRQIMVNPSPDPTRFDRLMADALPIAATLLEEHAETSSFRETYLEAALMDAITAAAPMAVAEATGRKRIHVPNWDRKLGGFDLRVRLAGPTDEALIETKVDDVEDTLWDLFKLASGLTLPGVEAGYLVVARQAQCWENGDCAELFAEREGPKRWDSMSMFENWGTAWAELIGPRGGLARPTSVPSEIETAFLGRARAKGFDGYEIRCVAVRLALDAPPMTLNDGWPIRG